MSTTDAAEKPVRRFPPPCWTQDETLALIDAYRERWYALRRGYLRTADWEAVTADVTSRFPDASPPKTSAQCRHKIEKLRQRYRAEKQRSLSYPGRFFSSWFFFDRMDSMENGTFGSNQVATDRGDSENGSRSKRLVDQNSVTVGFIPTNSWQINENSNPKLGFDRNLVPPGPKPKNRGEIDGKSCSNFDSRVLNGYPSYLNHALDEKHVNFGDGFNFNASLGGYSMPTGSRAKKFARPYGNSRPKYDYHHDGGDENVGSFANNQIELDSVPPELRTLKYDEMMKPDFDCSNVVDADGGFWVKISSGRNNAVPPGMRGIFGGNTDKNSKSTDEPMVLNGFPSSLSLGLGKEEDGSGPKRERDLLEEIVSSINLLGERFVKMEKMKMDMAWEMEKTRMEMEIKRNELILQSQQQIVEAFVKGLLQVKNKKVKSSVPRET